MFDVVTVGGSTRDIFFNCRTEGKIVKLPSKEELLAFDFGSKIIPEDAFFTYGGGAFNTAISFARQGLKVASLTCVGEEGTGDLIVKTLEQNDVNTSFVQRTSKNHSGLSIIISVKRDHIAFLYRGANNDLRLNRTEELSRTKWFYITSLNGEAASLLPELIDLAQSKNIRIAINPGQSQLKTQTEELRRLLKDCEILILNKEESVDLAGEKTDVNEKILLQKLLDFGPRLVAITDGEQGSYVGTREEQFFCPAARSLYCDSTGAGDAFGSTFVSGIIREQTVLKSQRLASINAASAVEHMGATDGLLEIGQIEKRLARITVK